MAEISALPLLKLAGTRVVYDAAVNGKHRAAAGVDHLVLQAAARGGVGAQGQHGGDGTGAERVRETGDVQGASRRVAAQDHGAGIRDCIGCSELERAPCDGGGTGIGVGAGEHQRAISGLGEATGTIDTQDVLELSGFGCERHGAASCADIVAAHVECAAADLERGIAGTRCVPTDDVARERQRATRDIDISVGGATRD